MRLVILNPNTTDSMTDLIDKAAKSVAAIGTEIITVTSSSGPESIESAFDEQCAVTGVMQTVLDVERKKSADAIIIACYGDPGLQVAREISSCPVIGVAQASMYMAAMTAAKFSVITDLSRGVCATEELAQRYGMGRQCVSVLATGVPVLGFEKEHSKGLDALEEYSRLAIKNDGAEAICLGCAGLASFAEELELRIGVPVFDGVTAAVKLAEGLVSMKKCTSKVCTYSTPALKDGKGFGKDMMALLKNVEVEDK